MLTVKLMSRGKPDPQMYLLAAQRLSIDPSQMLVLEDSSNGLAAAVAAACLTPLQCRASIQLIKQCGTVDRRVTYRPPSCAPRRGVDCSDTPIFNVCEGFQTRGGIPFVGWRFHGSDKYETSPTQLRALAFDREPDEYHKYVNASQAVLPTMYGSGESLKL